VSPTLATVVPCLLKHRLVLPAWFSVRSNTQLSVETCLRRKLATCCDGETKCDCVPGAQMAGDIGSAHHGVPLVKNVRQDSDELVVHSCTSRQKEHGGCIVEQREAALYVRPYGARLQAKTD